MFGFVYSMYFEVKYVIAKAIMLTCIIVAAIISLLFIRLESHHVSVILLKSILTEINCNVSHELSLLPVMDLISACIFLDLSAPFNTIGHSLSWMCSSFVLYWHIFQIFFSLTSLAAFSQTPFLFLFHF